MQIHPSSLERLRSAQFRPEAIATIFEHMGKMTGEIGAAASEFTLGYQKDEDEVREGDMVPVIVLALRPAKLSPAKPAEATA
jgi:hypothetical protein